jgi:alpha-tubulin suppressor-like RCC1 family protein
MRGCIGNGNTTNQSVPINIMTGSITGSSLNGKTVIKVAGGQFVSAALDSNGQVHTWGQDYFGNGCFGNGVFGGTQYKPIMISNISGSSLNGKVITQLFGGENDFFAALDSNGQLHMWGANSFGQLGNGTTTNVSLPINISIINNGSNSIYGKTIASLPKCNDTYGFMMAVIDSNGQLHTWGDNTYGQLGIGNLTTTQSLWPTNISILSGNSLNGKQMTQFSMNSEYTGSNTAGPFCMALDTLGQVHYWGFNLYTFIGLTTYNNTVVKNTNNLNCIPTPYNISGMNSILTNNPVSTIAAGPANMYFII